MNQPSDTAEMPLAAAQKLLPPWAMARGVPYTAAREVQGRLLAGMGQQDGQILV